MKPKKVKEEGEHDVTITITIAKASLTVADQENKKNDLPQVQNYFHCQYKLLPDDREPTHIDVVTYGVAAKMYGDHDTKILRTWLEGNKTWVAWSCSRKIKVTQELLLKIFNHNFEMKVWDTKDKVSGKARFDRPKAFRLPTTKGIDDVDMNVVREMLKQEGKTNVHLAGGVLSESDIDLVGSDGHTEGITKRVLSFEKSTVTTSKRYSLNDDSNLEVRVALDENKQPMFKNLMSLATSGANPLAMDTVELEVEDKPSTAGSDRKTRSRKARQFETSSGSSKLKKVQNDYVEKNGLVCISVPMSAWFTNATRISNNMEKTVGSLQEVIVILSLDEPLLSDRQKQVLNPMVLTVGSATQMPENHMSFSALRERCAPPYFKYKFHDCPEHIVLAKQQCDILKFNNRNVILLGTMKKQRLFEFLRGPNFKIEIHDRDPRNVPQKQTGRAGQNPQNDAIWSVSNSGGAKTELEDCTRYYGIAEFDLSPLLAGEKILQLISPIRNCQQVISDPEDNFSLLSKENGKSKKKMEVYRSIFKTENPDSGIPPGNYLEYGSDLKIKVELARSLRAKDVNLTESESRILTPTSTNDSLCPYNRIVYIFGYANKSILREILSEINDINAHALNLQMFPKHVIEAALSTYRLTDKQKNDCTLDIITGCQVIDGEYHIFILEGLAKNGIDRLWNKLEHPEYNEDSFFHMLYNSSMTFTDRLYIDLDVDLTRVKVYQSLSKIVQQPLLYVRDMIPRMCFDAVTKLFQLCQCANIQSAVRNELLPTAEMIVSLGKEFGVPLTSNDFHDTETKEDVLDNPIDESNDEKNNTLNEQGEKKKKRKKIDIQNKTYEKILKARKNRDYTEKNHICANIKSLLALSKVKLQQLTVTCDNLEVAHNYSTQALNSTTRAKEVLRELLAKDKSGCYTYCQKYNSATFVPVSVDKLTKEEEKNSKELWKTKEGFVYPGVKSLKESNQHSKPLPRSRVEELELPWRESVFYKNTNKPTVNRLLFKWEDRHLNFDTLTRPEAFFGQRMPVTIHSAGDTLAGEMANIKKEQEKTWKEKLVVDDAKFKTHRCLPATELKSRGPKASNQLDRSTDILKDKPIKLSLVKNGLDHDNISPLSVVAYPGVDTNRRNNGKLFDPDEYVNQDKQHAGYIPGDLGDVSWTRNKNIIPVKDYQHAYFKKTKGEDFRFVHIDRDKVTMKIKELTDEEKDNNLFFKTY